MTPSERCPVFDRHSGLLRCLRFPGAWTGPSRLRATLLWTATAGVILLLLFGAHGLGSIRANKLRGVRYTWMPVVSHLSWDFLGNYQAVRALAQGINPYREPYGDPANTPYCYAPFVLHL